MPPHEAAAGAADVNTSEFRFTVNGRGEVVYGLGAIKGIAKGR